MNRTLFLLTTLVTAAAAEDTLYTAEGVIISNIGTGYLQTDRIESTRFYDSTKGAEWVTDSGSSDSLMCWLHAASNVIQYWQSYYGVFARPRTGNYFDHNTNQWVQDAVKPLPYGKIGTENASFGDTTQVPDGRRLEVARDLYQNASTNRGGTFKWAAEWFFRGAVDWPSDSGTIFLNTDTGGYYADYFGRGTPFEEDRSYTTEYSAARNSITGVHHSSNGQAFADTDIGRVKDLLTAGLGIHGGEQAEKGLIPFIGTWNSSSGSGHMLACYGFTTDGSGNLKSIIIADSNDDINYNSALKELFIKVNNNRIELYTNSALTRAWNTSGSGVNYIGEVSYINTPEVLKNMLAEYSDTAREAQVWNGCGSIWKADEGTAEALPTAATGWDIRVDGDNIAPEHQGYYHTYAVNGRSVLFDDHAAADKRSITIEGTVAADRIEVAAAGYEFNAGADAALQAGAKMVIHHLADLSSAVSLNLSELTLEGNARLSSTQTISVSGAFIAQKAESSSYTLRNSVSPGASIYADLDLSGASAVIPENSVSMNGHKLLLNSDTPITLSPDSASGNSPFFTDVGELVIIRDGKEQNISLGSDLTDYLTFSTDSILPPTYRVVYTTNGNLMLTIPEPGSITLSLLGLVGAVLRRRRK